MQEDKFASYPHRRNGVGDRERFCEFSRSCEKDVVGIARGFQTGARIGVE